MNTVEINQQLRELNVLALQKETERIHFQVEYEEGWKVNMKQVEAGTGIVQHSITIPFDSPEKASEFLDQPHEVHSELQTKLKAYEGHLQKTQYLPDFLR